MTGQEKAQETRDKIAGEVNIGEAAKEAQMVEAKTSIAAIAQNKELSDIYNESANLGSEAVAGESLPLLKVHVAGRSQNDELANGQEPHNGWFYSKRTKTEYEKVICHVLAISEGFRTDGIEGKTNIFNQILSGVIINDGNFEPFMMFFTGTKLPKLWEFGKKASEYTKAKPQAIPMYALTVEMSTQKVTEGAKSWYIVNLEIVKDEVGNPVIVTDRDMAILLRDNVNKVKESMSKFISFKSTSVPVVNVNVDTDSAGRPIEDIVIPDDMPF